MNIEALAVTGLGVVSPIGSGRREFWQRLCQGESALKPKTLAFLDQPYLLAAVEEVEAKKFLAGAALRRIDRLSRMIGVAASMAFEDAELGEHYEKEQTGIVIGSAYGNIANTVEYLARVFEKGPAFASPMTFPNLVLNAPASYAAIHLESTGPNLSVTQGEVSGEQAIICACEMISKGQASAVLAGAGDELQEVIVDAYRSLKALSPAQGASSRVLPYDRGRDGIGLGEGSAVVAIETIEGARQRKAKIYAEIDYWNSFSIPAPLFDWPRRADDAIRRIKDLLAPSLLDEVDVVMASGNGSKSLDAFEVDLLSALFENSDRPRYLTTLKGAIGEFGSVGVLSMLSSALALRDDRVPPLPESSSPITGDSLCLVAGDAIATPVRRVLQISISRGGVIAMLSLRKSCVEGD